MPCRCDKKIEVKALVEGRIVVIDNAHITKDITYAHLYDYLGEGLYYSVDGKRVHTAQRMHFWSIRNG